jgi:hypothetical protein
MKLSNEELQRAIDSLLEHFELPKRKWCESGSPDGALSDCLGSLVYEQAKRASEDKEAI